MKRGRLRGAPLQVAGVGTPGVVRQVLDNGLTVVACPCPQLSQAYVAAFFGVGSRLEAVENNGITHMLEHMLFRGTDNFRDATELNAAAEDFGGYLDGATYRDHVAFATACHPSATTRAIDILGELIQKPRYSGLDIERGILHEEILETLDGQGRVVDLDNIAHRAIFGAHPLGLPIEGTLAILDSADEQRLEEHRRQHLVGCRAVVSVAGAVDPDEVIRSTAAAFSALPTGKPVLCTVPAPPMEEPVLRFVRDTSSQVELRISFRAVPVTDPMYPALVMLGRLLADGLASRMHSELVDRRGLAYSLHAGLTTYADCGLFEFEVSVAPHRAADVVGAILRFARAARDFHYTDTELERVWRRYQYGMEFMRDSPSDLAGWHGRASLFAIEHEMANLGERIVSVCQSEIREGAETVFRRSGLVVSAVGELVRGEWRRLQDVVAGW